MPRRHELRRPLLQVSEAFDLGPDVGLGVEPRPGHCGGLGDDVEADGRAGERAARDYVTVCTQATNVSGCPASVPVMRQQPGPGQIRPVAWNPR